MTVLVTAASRHGATAEIARALAEGLARRGLGVQVVPPAAVHDLQGYDAVVLGSAVYAGRWRRDARALAARIGRLGTPPPVWLFSSGPVGDPPVPAQDAPDMPAAVGLSAAVEHRTFPGRLDRRLLGPVERLVVRAVGAADGDRRDWAAVDAYAATIAAALAAGPVPRPRAGTHGGARPPVGDGRRGGAARTGRTAARARA